MGREAWVSLEEISNHLGVTIEKIQSFIENEGLPVCLKQEELIFRVSKVEDWRKLFLERKNVSSLDFIEGNVRPFFGFYGGKWRDAVKYYPKPKFDQIVEPFAGSAGYSLRYYNRKIVLCDIDPVIFGVWKYLTKVSAKEILSIPDIDLDGSVDDLKLPEEAKWLVGFWLNRGASNPRKTPSRWMRDQIRPGSFWGARVRNTIANQVGLIRHWKVYNCNYHDCPIEGKATWFVDPPYQKAGKHYRFSSDGIDFQSLGNWCRALTGQVIVCENEGANWLPFEDLADIKTTRSGVRSKEVIWIKDSAQSRPKALRSL